MGLVSRSPIKHTQRTRVRLNIKMSSYQYMDPHVKDTTVSGPCLVFNMCLPLPAKDGLYIETGPGSSIIAARSIATYFILRRTIYG